MSELTMLETRKENVNTMFKANRDRLLKIAPPALNPERLMYVAYTAIVMNPKLLQCSKESLLAGVVESVKLGLHLGGPMQEAHLIPYGNTATLVVGYMGYRSLIDRSGSVKSLHPYAVHNGWRPRGESGTPDEFDFWLGDEPRIIHKPRNAFPQRKEELAAVYAVAHLKGGGKQFEVLMPEEIEAHRNRSRAKDNGPWVTDYVPMALKTAIRKIAKYLPKATLPQGVGAAIEIDDKADRGEPLPLTSDFVIPKDDTDDPAPPAAEPPAKTQTKRLADKLKEEPAGPLKDSDINW